jgi:hypothetical protein
MQQQNHLRQIAPLNFRRVALGQVEVPAFRPKPVADARGRPPRPARPLLRRGPADRFDEQGANAAFRVITRHARLAAVNHMDDAVNGDGSFGHVGGDNHFAQAVGSEGQVLLLRRQFTMQGNERQRLAHARRAAGANRGVDFSHTGHENQNITRIARLDDLRHDIRRLLGLGPFVHHGKMPDFHRIGLALRNQNGAVAKVFGDRFGFQRGGHDHHAQVGPAGLLQTLDQRQRDVAQKVALVKLIEQHGADVLQRRVVLQPAQQHALGHEANSRAQAGVVFKTNLVADFPAQRAVPLPSHPRRHRAGRHAPGLQDNDAPAAQPAVQQHLRHLRRLARSGRGNQNQAIALAERLHDLTVNLPDRKRSLHAQPGIKSSAAKTAADNASIKPEGINFLPLAKRMPKTTSNSATRMSAM